MDKKVIAPPDLQGHYFDWHFSPAVESGGFVFVSGCTGTKPDGIDPTNIAPTNIIEQFRLSFQKIEKSLAEAGLSFADVVEMTTYHVGLRSQLEDFKRVKDEFICEPYPAWTAIGVSELAVEGALIEIRVIAKTATN